MKNPAEANPEKLRVIKTARTEKAINKAAQAGFRPLIRKVERSDEINAKFAIFQNIASGEIKVAYDFLVFPGADFEEVIGWTNYYPHVFSCPFAAYLIPRDILARERVFLEDLIEDLPGMAWNQGDCFRLESCVAVWTGTDLEIQYDPDSQRMDVVG